MSKNPSLPTVVKEKTAILTNRSVVLWIPAHPGMGLFLQIPQLPQRILFNLKKTLGNKQIIMIQTKKYFLKTYLKFNVASKVLRGADSENVVSLFF